MNYVFGSWLDNVEIDGKKYWDIRVFDPKELIKTKDPLPSDCRFREDCKYLSEDNLDKASE